MKNDNSKFLQGISDTATIESLKEYEKTILELQQTYKQTLDSMLEAAKNYQNKAKDNNPYAQALAIAQKEQEELNANVGYYKDAQEKRLNVDRWYIQEYNKIMANKKGMSADEQTQAFADLNQLYNFNYAQADAEVWQERGEKIGDIVGDGMDDILTKYNDFGDSMKNMATDIANYLIKESVRALLQQAFATEQMKGLIGALETGSKKGGFMGTAFNIIKGLGKGIGIFHSGGIVPVGANAEVPGTQEQLALLKGGERILSPGENASYNSGQGSSSPIVLNNFNVKAWDSKDVKKYLLENRQLLNQITFQGIKDNNAQLRHMVRNA